MCIRDRDSICDYVCVCVCESVQGYQPNRKRMLESVLRRVTSGRIRPSILESRSGLCLRLVSKWRSSGIGSGELCADMIGTGQRDGTPIY